jgi:oligoribonuclease
MSADGNLYLWFDTEFSSLELENSRLLQVAAVLTDSGLSRVAPPEADINICIRLPEGERCSEWVEDNLGELLARCRSDEAVSEDEACRMICAYIDRFAGAAASEKVDRPVMAGNSLQCDWVLTRRFMPAVLDRLSYRILDVSSWKVCWKSLSGATPFEKETSSVVRGYFPGVFNADGEKHDAHFDVLASIAELNYYKSRIKIVAGG